MSEIILTVEKLKALLISHVKYGRESNEHYIKLKEELSLYTHLEKQLPMYIRTYQNLDQFSEYMRFEFNTYRIRRKYIVDSFKPILLSLHEEKLNPADDVTTTGIQKNNSDYIQQIWQKALERRTSDPEGAITLARTLLESTCKHILDEYKVEYGNAPDINQLYRLVSKELNLAPSQHTEQTFKQILGGCSSVVEGLGSLRNKIGDAHGQGKINFKPSARHAELAVNLAGAFSMFLLSSYEFYKQKDSFKIMYE